MGTTRLTKVLMDGGSGLNILYSSTLDKMGIPRSNLRPSKAPFYGIVPGKEAVPLGCIRLNVTFGQSDNFHKETLTFEVVDFLDVYHALLDRLCFAKFMVIPNYTYLKLKILGTPVRRKASTLWWPRAGLRSSEPFGPPRPKLRPNRAQASNVTEPSRP